MKTTRFTTVPCRFGGLSDSEADYSTARAVVVPLPYEATTSYKRGTADGPAAIIDASRNMELFDEELLVTPASVGIASLDPLDADARGPEHMVARIRDHLRPIIRDGKFFVALGGEHTVSVGCVQALAAESKEPFGVLQIDAHADLRDSYQDSPYSHACVMRRIGEVCPTVQVGIRSLSSVEHDFVREKGLSLFSMQRIRNQADWMAQAVDALPERVYVTVDLDGFDPAVCPAVGTPEPGGLGWYQVIDLLRVVFAERQVLAADVVECAPLSGQVVGEFLAARLVYKMIAYRFHEQ